MSPKEWPTLEEITGARELHSPISHAQALRLANAATFAVRIRPQLEALIDKWRKTTSASGHYAVGLEDAADDLDRILKGGAVSLSEAAHALAQEYPGFTIGQGKNELVMYAHRRIDMKVKVPSEYQGWPVRRIYMGKVVT